MKVWSPSARPNQARIQWGGGGCSYRPPKIETRTSVISKSTGVISTRTSVISTRKVQFPPPECDFTCKVLFSHTRVCFYTQSVNSTHTSVILTLMSVIYA
jgi:hypothetical protein